VSRFSTGITVVSTAHDGVRYGMTVNSFTSVSLDPVLVLFCCERDSSLHDPLLASGVWGVSVLAASQQAVSQWFATRGKPGVDQFDEWSCRAGEVTGSPLIDGALAWFECRTWGIYDGGDHTIVVGEVVDLGAGDDDGPPLLWDRGTYRTLG